MPQAGNSFHQGGTWLQVGSYQPWLPCQSAAGLLLCAGCCWVLLRIAASLSLCAAGLLLGAAGMLQIAAKWACADVCLPSGWQASAWILESAAESIGFQLKLRALMLIWRCCWVLLACWLAGPCLKEWNLLQNQLLYRFWCLR